MSESDEPRLDDRSSTGDGDRCVAVELELLPTLSLHECVRLKTIQCWARDIRERRKRECGHESGSRMSLYLIWRFTKSCFFLRCVSVQCNRCQDCAVLVR